MGKVCAVVAANNDALEHCSNAKFPHKPKTAPELSTSQELPQPKKNKNTAKTKLHYHFLQVLVAAAVSAGIGQLLKPFSSSWLYGKDFSLSSAIQAGGFPSTHSSAVIATATSIALERGFADPIFGMAVVYASLVMYDAQGVRREVGTHAKALNQILPKKSSASPVSSADNTRDPTTFPFLKPSSSDQNNLPKSSPTSTLIRSSSSNVINVNSSEDDQTSLTLLKESIGHTEVEVIAGGLLGFLSPEARRTTSTKFLFPFFFRRRDWELVRTSFLAADVVVVTRYGFRGSVFSSWRFPSSAWSTQMMVGGWRWSARACRVVLAGWVAGSGDCSGVWLVLSLLGWRWVWLVVAGGRVVSSWWRRLVEDSEMLWGWRRLAVASTLDSAPVRWVAPGGCAGDSFGKLISHWKKKIEKWSEEQKKKKSEIEDEAYNLLVLSLADSVLRKVSTCKTPTALWTKLADLYSNKHAPNLAFLKASLFAFKMDSSKCIDENLDEFLKMSLLLNDTLFALDDTSIVMILMNSLPDQYQVVKDAFQYTGTVPAYDLLCSALRTRECELKNLKSRSGSGLFVKNKTPSNNFNRFKSNNNNSNRPRHDKRKDVKPSNNNSAGKETRKCYYCGNVGHLRKQCNKWLNRTNTNANHETNVATTNKCDGAAPEVLSVTDRSSTDQ
ncbi:unnamed protein product [Rhodiola kirilowii]